MASTIETKINRISDNIAATYSAVEEMGGTVPEAANSDNLPEAVRTIPASGVVVDPTFTIPGAAADAKETGDALNQLKNDLDNKVDFAIAQNLTSSQQTQARENIGIRKVTQAEYDALTDTSGIYIIMED